MIEPIIKTKIYNWVYLRAPEYQLGIFTNIYIYNWVYIRAANNQAHLLYTLMMLKQTM